MSVTACGRQKSTRPWPHKTVRKFWRPTWPPWPWNWPSGESATRAAGLDGPAAGGGLFQARELLADLGALDTEGRATDHGRRMAGLPLHPRLAHMLLKAESEGLGASACDLAALANERDIIRFAPGEQDADLGLRMDIMQKLRRNNRLPHGPWRVDRAAARRVATIADNLKKRLGYPREHRHHLTGGPAAGLGLPGPNRPTT